MKKPRIMFADSTKVDQLEKWINKVVEAILGHHDAMITDLSCISDFASTSLTENDFNEEGKLNLSYEEYNNKIDEWTKNISHKLGVEVDISDYIWQVAERVKANESSN